tara:strand:+ start:671 stop:844 length:174 start_codon:yes stop_codon:yes gene_type:complete
MYKLKKRYKDHISSTGGYAIALNNVLSSQVETLGLQDYFVKTTKNDVKTEVKKKENK